MIFTSYIESFFKTGGFLNLSTSALVARFNV